MPVMTLLKNKNMKNKAVLLLGLSVLFYSCKNNYIYKSISLSVLSNYKIDTLKKIGSNNYLKGCKDYGAPTNDVCFLVVQKANEYFKINPDYRFSFYGDSTILLYKVITCEPSIKGNWIWIDRQIKNGVEETKFRYDTIPTNKSYSISIAENKIYHLKGKGLSSMGDLTSYKSLHDLPENGFYYLSPPGLFYEVSININDLK